MNKKIVGFIKTVGDKRYYMQWFAVVLLLISAITAIVYLTGGTSSTVQLLYIPIFIAVFAFGIKGGLVAAVAAGLAVGPFMPNGATHEMQPTIIWVLRIVMSVFIVLVVGGLSEHIKKTNELEKKKAYKDFTTGYYNSNKLNLDLGNEIKNNKYVNISIILFEFENMEMVKRYMDFETSLNSYIELHKMAEEFFNMSTIYTVLDNKIAVMLPGIKIDETNNLARKFIQSTKNPLYIDNLPISLVIKGGIVNYPNHEVEPGKLIVMLDKALYKACTSHNSTAIYDNVVEKEHERYFKDLVSLYHALKNNMFTLAFQPIIDIKKNKINSVEALLRWNDSNHNNMSISELIKRAEDAGFINEITKWLFGTVTKQLKIWKEHNIEVTVSMNLSSRDLADEAFIDYVKSYIEDNNIEAKFIEFELTETSIINDEIITSEQLMRMRNAGIKLSLDDYGTGFNSIKNLMDFAGKFDYLKIDKMFIDRIIKDEKLIMVDCIIEAAHRLGMKVIAEGVEIREQLEILNNIDCDMVQGYYYSKPLPPEELEQFIMNFNNNKNKK